MARVLLIGFAGGLGAMARYLVTLWASRALGPAFPYGTLFVNVAGCFLMAAIMRVALTTSLIPATLQLTITTGFLGGLTTYSSFNYETTTLLRDRALSTGLLNLGVTVVACFVAGLLGLAAAQRFVGHG
jgi:CrcB protein